MTVNVYPSTLAGAPLGRYPASGTNLQQWLDRDAPCYLQGLTVSASIDGELIPVEQWSDVMLGRGVDVELRVQPNGLEGALLAAVISGVLAAASAFLLKPSIPGVNRRESTQGSRLLEVNAQGNQPKLGDVIPDQAGRVKKFPDLLTAPIRRFVDQRSQALYLFFSLGVGEFERDENDLAIGETPVNSLPGISYQFFEPGDDVSGHPAAENWYNAPEVGASTGAAGLRLRGVTEADAIYTGTGSAGVDRISILSGIPSGWTEDLRLRVFVRQSVTVGSNGESIFGDFPHLANGNLITIQGTTAISGIYRVRSVTGSGLLLEDRDTGVPIDDLIPGDYEVYIDRSGALYGLVERISNNQIAVMQRYTDAETIDTTWGGWPELLNTQLSIQPSDETPASLWTGTFLACPKNETTSVIEWDVFCPNGLGYIEDDGRISQRSIDVELTWRDGPNGDWNSIIKTVTGATRDQLGWTFRDTIPAASPQTRARRLTLENTSTQALDRIEWYGLRCQLSQNASYPGVSTLALVISGSDLIASQTENQVNLIETRKLPIWNGSEWTAPQATRDIAPYFRYIVHSRGYTDDDIDMDELLRLDSIWKGRGDTFDFIFDRSITMKDAANTVLRAGMAELTIDHGRLRPVREELRTVPEHMYTLQNMPGELRRKFTGPRPEDPDGIDVEYRDENSWTIEVVECRLPGDQGIRPKKVRLDGVGNRDQAYQIGMRERCRLAYQRWEYEWPTECDGLNSKYKSFCALADDVPGYARSAILLDVEVDGDDVHLQSSEPFDWQEGESYVIAWRRPDGTLSGPHPAQRGDSDDHVIAQMSEIPVIYSDMEPPHLLWGTTERWCYQAIVEDVEPQGFESVTLKALNYDARVYAYDDVAAPN